MDQEGVDAGSPRRPECVPEDLMRLFEIDIAHHVEGAVQIAVADGGDDDISDSAMIDAGNLLCGLWRHVGKPQIRWKRWSGSIRRRSRPGRRRSDRR